jgi:N4-gp56 family major capsid protein
LAVTYYGVNAPEAVKLWSRKLAREVRKNTWIDRFVGDTANHLIQNKDDAKQGVGDQISITLRMLLTGDGVVGDSPLEGNEESLTTYVDKVTINQLRHAVRSAGEMSEERIPFVYRDEAKDALVEWWAERYDQSFFNQVCGYTPANVQAAVGGVSPYTGFNTIVAPGPTRRVMPPSRTNDEDIASTDLFNLQTIDRAVERAKIATPMIRPCMIKSEKYYAMFLHPFQVTDLRISTASGQWLDIQKAAMAGMKSDESGIFTGALGMYNNVVLHEAIRVTQGVNSSTGVPISTVRRAVFCGAQSAFISHGKDSSFKQMSWKESMFDYGNQLGVKAGVIYGIKKSVFNSLEFGCLTVPTYAVAH